jgi:hypothetical protein
LRGDAVCAGVHRRFIGADCAVGAGFEFGDHVRGVSAEDVCADRPGDRLPAPGGAGRAHCAAGCGCGLRGSVWGDGRCAGGSAAGGRGSSWDGSGTWGRWFR